MRENYYKSAQLFLGILTAIIIVFQALDSGAQALPDSLHTLVNNYHESSMFNGFVRVEKEGKILLNRSYGLGDYEKKVVIDENTRFRLGSLSKQFTAYVILMLAQEGKLNLTDTLGKYFPDYTVAHAVTINQLLHHTAGIPNFTDFNEYDSIKKTTTLASQWLIQNLTKRPLDFQPGTDFNYSNSGYVLLSIIAEKTTGTTWSKLMKKYIVHPAGLSNTGTETIRLIDSVIPGYDEDLKVMINVADQINPSIANGGGSNFSSARDLSQWIDYLLTTNNLRGTYKELLFTPDKNNYAKGWEVHQTELKGDRLFYHSGGIDGFRTAIIVIPAQQIKVIVLSNMESGIVPRQLPFQLLSITQGKPTKFPEVRKIHPTNLEIVQPLLGEYVLNGRILVQLKFVEGYLRVQFPNQSAVRLYSMGSDQYFTINVDALLTFHRDVNGKVISFTLQQGSATVEAHRKN